MSGFAAPSEMMKREWIERDLAETFLLLDFLSSSANSSLGSLVDVPTFPAPKRRNGSDESARIEEIDADLQNPTALVLRLCAIREAIDAPDFGMHWADDAAFLKCAKDILNDRAAPATSTSIAFTAMVFNRPGKIRSDLPEKTGPDGESNYRDLAERAFPNLRVEALRLSRSIHYVIPATIILAMLLVVVIAASASPPTANPYWSANPYWLLARAVSATAVLPALLGLLGALAATLRRFQQLAAAHLLNPRERNRQTVDGWLGLLAGTTVWLVLGGGLAGGKSLTFAIFPLAFLAGYSTDLVFSILDGLITRISRNALLQNRPSQFNALVKSQTKIVSTVSQIHDQIEQFQGSVTLDPFEGVVIMRLRQAGSDPVPILEQLIPPELSGLDVPAKLTGASLKADQPYELFVTLDRRATGAQDAVVERVSTGSGGPPVSVAFEVNINARGVTFAQKVQELTIERRSQSTACVYSFRAPARPGRYEIFAEISQKKRLVQVALLPVFIEPVTA